jgi:hypothetical protein
MLLMRFDFDLPGQDSEMIARLGWTTSVWKEGSMNM